MFENMLKAMITPPGLVWRHITDDLQSPFNNTWNLVRDDDFTWYIYMTVTDDFLANVYPGFAGLAIGETLVRVLESESYQRWREVIDMRTDQSRMGGEPVL